MEASLRTAVLARIAKKYLKSTGGMFSGTDCKLPEAHYCWLQFRRATTGGRLEWKFIWKRLESPLEGTLKQVWNQHICIQFGYLWIHLALQVINHCHKVCIKTEIGIIRLIMNVMRPISRLSLSHLTMQHPILYKLVSIIIMIIIVIVIFLTEKFMYCDWLRAG